MDRNTFKYVVVESTIKKRNHYEEILSSMEIFKEFGSYEMNLIIDGLQERNISQGDIIVRQGDHGEEFFIIEEGKAVVLKTHGGETAGDPDDMDEND